MKIVLVAWHSLLQQWKDQKSQLHYATKPCSLVIHRFVENDVITYDVIGHLNGWWPHFMVLDC